MSRFSLISAEAGDRRARLPKGERIYAIGDIHGRLDLFEALISTIRDDNQGRKGARVRVVLLGDLIDRGPSSAELVARCRALAMRADRFVVLRGNHEAMMLHALGGNYPALALWLRSGGDAALRSWGVSEAALEEGSSLELLAEARARVPADAVEWLDGLPLTMRAGGYFFVHAGVRPGTPLEAQSPADLLWIRTEFLESAAFHGSVVVHGHSAEPEGVVIRPGRIGIDTGAYRSGVLTALGLEGDKRWTLATAPADAVTGRIDRAGTHGHAATKNDRLDDDLAAILGSDPDASPAYRAPVARRRSIIPVIVGVGVAAAAAAAALLLPLYLTTSPHRSLATQAPPARGTVGVPAATRGPAYPAPARTPATPGRRPDMSANAEIAIASPPDGAIVRADRVARARPVTKGATPPLPPEKEGGDDGPPPTRLAQTPAPSPAPESTMRIATVTSRPVTVALSAQADSPDASDAIPERPISSDAQRSRGDARTADRRASKRALTAIDAIRLLRRQ